MFIKNVYISISLFHDNDCDYDNDDDYDDYDDQKFADC